MKANTIIAALHSIHVRREIDGASAHIVIKGPKVIVVDLEGEGGVAGVCDLKREGLAPFWVQVPVYD